MKHDFVPTEEEWGDYCTSLDQKWAHDKFIGKTVEEVIPRFVENPGAWGEALAYMPYIPFRYYVHAFTAVLCPDGKYFSQLKEQMEASNAASGFLCLLQVKLENFPETILPVLEDLLSVAELLAANQERFGADPSIYGSFQERLLTIKQLYASLKFD